MSVSEPGRVFPTAAVPEPPLTYDPQTNRWSGANSLFSIWMDDATFRAYAAAWCDYTCWLPDLPPAERLAAAVTRCRRIGYWYGCECNYDPRVHITYHSNRCDPTSTSR